MLGLFERSVLVCSKSEWFAFYYSMATAVKRKQWQDKDMVLAMEAVSERKESIYSASKRYNVPRRTLEDRVKGRVKHGVNPGSPY